MSIILIFFTDDSVCCLQCLSLSTVDIMKDTKINCLMSQGMQSPIEMLDQKICQEKPQKIMVFDGVGVSYACLRFILFNFLYKIRIFQLPQSISMMNHGRQSLAGQVIIKVNMYGGQVLLLGRNLQLLIELRLVLNPIINQSGIHVEDLPLPLPGVALGMHVDLLVAVQNLPDRLLPRDLQLVLSVAEGIDDPDELALLGELANEELLVLPPGDGERVANEFQMQVPPLGDIELLLALRVDEGARLFGLFVEPGGDVSACSLDDGVDLWQVAALLDELREVVDVVEEGDPDVVGRVVGLQFGEDVVAPLVVGLRQQLLGVICCTLFRHLIIHPNYHGSILMQRVIMQQFIIMQVAAGDSYAATANMALLDFMDLWVLPEHLREAAL